LSQIAVAIPVCKQWTSGAGQKRNPPPEFADMSINQDKVDALMPLLVSPGSRRQPVAEIIAAGMVSRPTRIG